MALTAKQEAFAQAIASGRTQSDAVRAASDTGEWKPETVWNDAYKLMQIGDVKARIKELQDQLSEISLWTRHNSIEELKKIVFDERSKPSEITAALKEINAMHGYNAPTKLQITDENGGAITGITRTIID